MYRITETRFYLEHGRIVGNDGDAATAAVAISGFEGREEEEGEEHEGGGRMVEIQDRRITNARRPSFVVGALTANSKLR